MEKGTGSYEQVLQRAKAHGYAEADPSADVLGWDAGRKICILASIAFGKQVYYDKIDIQGIEQIDVEDIRCAALIGGTIKLIAKAGRSSDGKIYANVAPAIVLKDNPLHSVDGVFNAVLVRGDAVGEVMFYGKGAGAYPTASAAVADLIDIVRHDGDARGPYWEDLGDGYTCDGLDMRTDYLLRIKTNSGEAGRQLGALLGADAFSEIETDRAGQLVAKVALTRQKQAVLARIEDEIGPVKALKILS